MGEIGLWNLAAAGLPNPRRSNLHQWKWHGSRNGPKLGDSLRILEDSQESAKATHEWANRSILLTNVLVVIDVIMQIWCKWGNEWSIKSADDLSNGSRMKTSMKKLKNELCWENSELHQNGKFHWNKWLNSVDSIVYVSDGWFRNANFHWEICLVPYRFDYLQDYANGMG